MIPPNIVVQVVPSFEASQVAGEFKLPAAMLRYCVPAPTMMELPATTTEPAPANFVGVVPLV